MSINKTINKIFPKNLELIIWKSFDRFDEFLNGKTDIDVFSNENVNKFIKNCSQHGWKKFKSENWRYFDDVHDLFYLSSVDDKPVFYHMHFFENIRTGTSYTKNLFIPKHYYSSANFEGNIKKVDKNSQDIIDFIRSVYKFRILNYYYFFRYRKKEYLFLDPLQKSKFIESINKDNNIDLEHFIFLKNDKFLKLFKKEQSYLIDFFIRHYVLFKTKHLTTKSYLIEKILFYKKVIQKKILSDGKRITNKKFLVALVAPDGSGKTSITNEVFKIFEKQFKIKKFYLGINKKIQQIRKGLSESVSLNSKTNLRNLKHLYNSISSLIVSINKLFYFIRINYFESGSIIIIDRYPLKTIDTIPSYKKSIFKKFEANLNKFIPKVDLLIYINTSPENIHYRTKLDKEIVNENITHYQNEFNLKEVTKKVIIDNNAHMEIAVNQVVQEVWKNL